MNLLATLAVLATLAGADDTSPTPMLDQLGVEASKVEDGTPKLWVADQDRVDRAVADHAKLVAGWRKRSSPPTLDLKPLKLPLSFLVTEARRLGESPNALDPRKLADAAGLPAVRLADDRSHLHAAYLDAIAGHPDERRIAALQESRDVLERRWPGIGRSLRWPRLLAIAATRDWAAAQIRDLAREAPAFDPSNRYDTLPFRLIDRFAGDLPPDAVTIAYDYLRVRDPHGPHNGERTWDVLLRLDPPRARREILAYFPDKTGPRTHYNIYVIRLLERHAGPSPEVAEEARKWLLRDDLDPNFRRDIRVILLRADPEHEVGPAVEHIDRLLAEKAGPGEMIPTGGDVHSLVLALGEVHTKPADDALARYVFERKIPDGIRALALLSLLRREASGVQALMARWDAEEAPHLAAYVRKTAAEERAHRPK